MTETARTIISVPIAVGAFLLAQLSVAPSLAAEYDVSSIHIAQPWSHATPKGGLAGTVGRHAQDRRKLHLPRRRTLSL